MRMYARQFPDNCAQNGKTKTAICPLGIGFDAETIAYGA
jgi:hypothetical protein